MSMFYIMSQSVALRLQKVNLLPAACECDATDGVCATYCHWKSLTNTEIVFASLLQTF